MNTTFSIVGNVVDIPNKTISLSRVEVKDGIIVAIIPLGEHVENEKFILPGFIDSHVHVESSMLIPSEFARLAVVHGTVATISDPHEIANVCGLKGVEYMIENGRQVPFKFNFGAPSCVPATIFETAGAALNAEDVEALLKRDEIKYLSEMMNFPGVLFGDDEVHKKIAAAIRMGKPIDGHAPGLRGEDAKNYIEAIANEVRMHPLAERVIISTDHECFSPEEALDKLQFGMKILIREGSAAKNFEALVDLLHDYSEQIMFCSDDKHPDSLVDGHINQLCARAVARGINVFKVLQAACVNPVHHYQLQVGLLKVGDPADFIITQDLVHFNIERTYINGFLVAEDGKTNISSVPSGIINHFNCNYIHPEDVKIKAVVDQDEVFVIEALDGQLITNKLKEPVQLLMNHHETLVSNTEADILKMVVINRYNQAPIAKSWIRNFGFKSGAIASTVAHDSHNIIAVGVDDVSICKAVNLVIAEQGGISCVGLGEEKVLGLPVAGLMSGQDGYMVAQSYTAIDSMAKRLGSTLSAPFMTLSFMALLVIPHLKLSDKGLFDGDSFALYSS